MECRFPTHPRGERRLLIRSSPALPAPHLRRLASRLFDLDTDLDPFRRLARRDSVLRRLAPPERGLRVLQFLDPFEALARAILGQSEQLYAGPRFGFLLMTIFGSIGLILVTMGVYGVLAYATIQKTHEIGIRMALGAERADVLGMIVATGLRLVGVGIAMGMAVSLVLGRMIKTQLVGVTAYDPLTLAATTLVLTLTAAVACWIPARGAARVDPTVALRYE